MSGLQPRRPQLLPQQPEAQQPEIQQPIVPARPQSPWRKRTKIDDNAKRDDVFTRAPVEHSGIAPDRPKYYGDPIDIEHRGFMDNDDVDRFFIADERFRARYHSIQAWQLGAMNRSLQFSRRGYVPGGHVTSLSRPGALFIQHGIYDMEHIVVNEDNWFPFWRKAKWLDTPGHSDPQLSANLWSVDDPNVWRQLSLSIELADRMLKATIKDRHPFIETLLWGQMSFWYDPDLQPAPAEIADRPLSKVLLSRDFLRKKWEERFGNKPFPRDGTINGFTEETWVRRIETLAASVQWALLRSAERGVGEFYGVNLKAESLICLNNLFLRGLMTSDDELTFAERCEMTVSQAVTILHELSHALIYARRVSDQDPLLTNIWPFDPRNPDYDEPVCLPL
ncbi:hypothetical protein F4678DRAFT_478712 [Xylaria arbuscula]|nr:hypothetical protein F4678DRAFT_478712 [Xylaria arbuscula]